MSRADPYLDARSLALLPPHLAPLAPALDVVTAAPRSERGWIAFSYPEAPTEPLRPGAPPYDGIYRGSWVSPGVCVRLDLGHPAVPPVLAERLRARFPEQIGLDGAFYEYGIDAPSQRDNRDQAVMRLIEHLGEPAGAAGCW